jgi:hypothetical protein
MPWEFDKIKKRQRPYTVAGGTQKRKVRSKREKEKIELG